MKKLTLLAASLTLTACIGDPVAPEASRPGTPTTLPALGPGDPPPPGETQSCAPGFFGIDQVEPQRVGTAFSVTSMAPGTVSWGDDASVYMGESHPELGTYAASHAYATPGVYTVTYTDDYGYSCRAEAFAVSYDPNGGHVTGGGWINSPAGAYSDDASLVGKATFGFVAKYQKGASVPTGHTEFQFHGDKLDFKSGTYQWLVVAGSKAQYKGVGTIKGRAGEFQFMLTAIDGGPGGSNDRFRMKITGPDGVVYDNQRDAGDGAEPSMLLANGNISVKK